MGGFELLELLNIDLYDLILPGALLLLILMMWLSMAVRKRKLRRLTEAIQTFLRTGTQLPDTARKSVAARLQAGIRELQSRVLRVQETSRQEARDNTDFISDMSHRLQTPLANLRLYCQMDAVNPNAQKELALIGNMEELIENVLTLENLRSNACEMSFAECEVGNILRSVTEELQPVFPRKHISAGGTAVLQADEKWLRMAVANVVKNACEHTAPNGTVSVLALAGTKALELTVEDNGGGVAPEELPKLFDRVRRSENTSSSDIGLAITQAIVEKHHGTICAENTYDGLKILMTLPYGTPKA